MLRPPARATQSYSRSALRSPQVQATDGHHPLEDALQVLDSSSGKQDLVEQVHTHTEVTKSSDIGQPVFRKTVPGSNDTISLALPSDHSRPQDSQDVRTTEVYVHRVKRTDTLPKIILQYGIMTNELRRANRIWASDSIQSRDTLFLPIHHCMVEEESSNTEHDLLCNLQPSPLRDCAYNIGIPHIDSNEDHGTADVLPIRSVELHSPLVNLDVPKQKKKLDTKRDYQLIRYANIPHVGLVEVARVPDSSLSYFPASLQNKQQGLLDVPRNTLNVRTPSFEADGHERGSFESLRIGAGQIAADAFNGTQGFIRRLKEKKNKSEIDLIEL